MYESSMHLVVIICIGYYEGPKLGAMGCRELNQEG